MKLIEILLPDPQHFRIRVPNGEEACISGYNNINISFDERISYVKGVREFTKTPNIEYTVYFDPANALILSKIFNTIEVKQCYIHKDAIAVMGINDCSFKVNISVIPYNLKMFGQNKLIYEKLSFTNNDNTYNVKITLKLDNVEKKDLFEDAEIIYKDYKRVKQQEIEELSRFDLMEIE